MPIEFSVAAYRFGHSQIPPSYRLNFGHPDLGHNPFFAFIFDDVQDPNDPDPNDLRGGKRATSVCRLADLLSIRRNQFPAQQTD